MDIRTFRKAGHTPSLIAALAHFDVSFMVWVMLGALGAYVSDDLGLSASEKGVLVAIPLLSAAGFRVVSRFTTSAPDRPAVEWTLMTRPAA